MLQVNRNVERVEHESAATQPSHVLHFAINFIRRQYVIIAIAVVLTTLLGVVYLNTTPPMFTAYARMLIDTRKQQVSFQQQPTAWDVMMLDSAMLGSPPLPTNRVMPMVDWMECHRCAPRSMETNR